MAAIQGHIYFFDPDLRVRSILEGDFVPVALSLDEASRVYLVADTRQGRALWGAYAAGPAHFSFHGPRRLPDRFHTATRGVQPSRVPDWRPPRDRGLGPDGKLLWERTAEAPVAALSPRRTTSCWSRPAVRSLAWNAAGEPRVLHRLDSDSLQTAPRVDLARGVVPASRTKLYCLVSR